jgi:murein DD-endopeptidase MepM/ murein hydrolase activator NlpD
MAMRIARSQTETEAVPILVAPALEVDDRPVAKLFPPLSGGIWKASGATSPLSYHGGAATLDGQTRLAERFAVDFQKVDATGNILPNPFPDEINNAMFYSNRADVYAVADGVVALVRDGIPENTPTPSGDENIPVPLTRESSAGNQISIKLAEGIYAQYAHLVPGSIRFKPGDNVRRGEVIGLVGNSGNSKNPHLHFEVADGPEINAAQGLPWVLEAFELYGHRGPDGMPDIRSAPALHRDEMPLLDAILRFPERPRR